MSHDTVTHKFGCLGQAIVLIILGPLILAGVIALISALGIGITLAAPSLEPERKPVGQFLERPADMPPPPKVTESGNRVK